MVPIRPGNLGQEAQSVLVIRAEEIFVGAQHRSQAGKFGSVDAIKPGGVHLRVCLV